VGVLPKDKCLLDLLWEGIIENQQLMNKSHFMLTTADLLLKKDNKKNQKSGLLGKLRRPINNLVDADFRPYTREILGVSIVYVK
jgi:hypothetical protein